MQSLQSKNNDPVRVAIQSKKQDTIQNKASAHNKNPFQSALEPPASNLFQKALNSPIQTQLQIGQPNDPYELEADRVAAQVMDMPDPTAKVQRQIEKTSIEEDAPVLQANPLVTSITPLIQRQGEELPPVPSYRLTLPSLLTPPDPTARYHLGGSEHLQLDPEIQAIALRYARQQLEPANLRIHLIRLSLGSISLTPTVSGASLTSPPHQTDPLVTPGAGPETPRPATLNDLISAILAIPTINTALTQLRTRAEERILSDWQRLTLGEQVGVVSSLAVIGSGAIAGILSSPDTRQWALRQLNGRVLPVPGLSWLQVEINTGSDALMMGFHLDVGALLPSRLGFGSRSPSAIGGPPEPESFVPGVQRSASSPQTPTIQPSLENRLSASRSSGIPLPDEVRSFMEPRFGTDFSQVRVHTGGDAVQMNQELGAQAFAHRSHIYYGAGKAPAKDELTGHELTHVVQQTGINQIQRLCGVNESCPEESSATLDEHTSAGMTSAEAPMSVTAPSFSTSEASTSEVIPEEESSEFDALVQAELESFLTQFSAITVTVRWGEETDTQCVQHEEQVAVHPPYFMNVTGDTRGDAEARTIDRYDTAMDNRDSADRATRGYIGEVGRSQRRGGLGMGRALVGKSTPEEIQTILQNALDRHLIQPQAGQSHPTSDDLRNWLVRYGIGVDCSAFVSQALNRVMEQVYGRPLADGESISLSSRGLRGGSRGFTEVEAEDLRPGDTMGISGHIRIVTSVRHDEDGNVVFITAESRAGGEADVGPDRAEWRYQGSQLQIRRSPEEAWTNSREDPTFGRYDRLQAAEEAQAQL